MYADDSILISHASRRIARNINMCFHIYENLTGHRANNTKSEVFFPNRFNKRLNVVLVAFLASKLAISLTYLEILISPKRLAMTHFNSMLDKVEHSISGWHHSRISLVGKSMLINSYIFSISLYYLFAYLVPDTVLEKIAKASRKYFWSKGGDRKGIPSVGWKDITLDLTEKGGGVF